MRDGRTTRAIRRERPSSAAATRLGLVAILLGTLLWTAGATAGLKVVGGTVIDIQQAPWQVLVSQERGGRTFTLCGGSIIDATRIVTAAHCVVGLNNTPTPATELAVRAGISNFVSPRPSDLPQDRRVASVRIHPGYSFTETGSPDDVAVLYLAAPLDLGAAGVKAIGLPVAGTLFAKGQRASLAGFGRQSGFSDADGSLNLMDTELNEQAECAGPDNAVIICAASQSVSVCSGDSGSALVVSGAIVGIASTGGSRCPRGGTGQFTNVTAPEILRFVQGEDNPPTAPRRTRLGSLSWPQAMQVGQSLECEPGGWTGEPTFIYTFLDGATGAVLQRSSSELYTLKPRDLGRKVSCRVAATTAGGTGVTQSDDTPGTVRPPPKVSTGTAVTRAGRKVVMRVTLTGLTDVKGSAEICVRPSLRVGTQTCGRARLTGAARLTAGVPVSVKTTAPSGLLRVGVAAVLSDGRTLKTVGQLRVRK